MDPLLPLDYEERAVDADFEPMPASAFLPAAARGFSDAGTDAASEQALYEAAYARYIRFRQSLDDMCYRIWGPRSPIQQEERSAFSRGFSSMGQAPTLVGGQLNHESEGKRG